MALSRARNREPLAPRGSGDLLGAGWLVGGVLGVCGDSAGRLVGGVGR